MTSAPKAPQNKVNKYIVLFFITAIAIFALFIATRSNITASEVSKIEKVEKKAAAAEKVTIAKYATLSPEKEKILKNTDDDMFLGNKYAPVVMIEYASLSCPHCAHFHEAVVDKIIPTYIDTGKVKYIYRDFPTNLQGFNAAKLTHCVPTEKYFPFVKALFNSQENWAFTVKFEAPLKSIAKLGGVSEAEFEKCMKDKGVEERILGKYKAAVDVLGVDSTPTIFINGHEYNGKHEAKDVGEFIDGLLKGE